MQRWRIETEANGANYKTASGERITDHGGLCMQRTTQYGHGVAFRGLSSASKVHRKGHVAVVDSEGGYIIPCSSTLARTIEHIVQSEIVSELGGSACVSGE